MAGRRVGRRERLTGSTDRPRRAGSLGALGEHHEAQPNRARAEKIIATAARTNSDKAAGPIARVLRDLLLPTAMKVLAKPEKMAWQFDYRIDWDAPVSGVSHQLARPA